MIASPSGTRNQLKFRNRIRPLSVVILAVLYCVGVLIAFRLYSHVAKLFVPQLYPGYSVSSPRFNETAVLWNLRNKELVGQANSSFVESIVQRTPRKNIIHLQELFNQPEPENFVLSQHIPSADEPWLPADGCPVPPFANFPMVDVRCQIELHDAILAYFVVLYSANRARLKCTHARSASYDIVPYNPILESRYRHRLDLGITWYEGSQVTPLVSEGVLLKIFSMFDLHAGRFLEIVSPITYRSKASSNSPTNYLNSKACGWKGRTVVLSSKQRVASLRKSLLRDLANRGAIAQRRMAKQIRLAHYLEFYETTSTAEMHFDNIPFDLQSGLHLLIVNLNNVNDFYVAQFMLKHETPLVLSARYNFGLGADMDAVAFSEYSSITDWDGTCYFGASFESFRRLAVRFGYRVVHVTFTDVYFVHNSLWHQYITIEQTAQFPKPKQLYKAQSAMGRFGGEDTPVVQNLQSKCREEWKENGFVSSKIVFRQMEGDT